TPRIGSTAAPSPRSSDELSDGLGHLLQATLAFSGLMAESMVRDAGWYLLDAGRRLERAMQVNALLRHTLTTAYPPEAQQEVGEALRQLYGLIATAHFVHPAALRPLDPSAVEAV